MVQPGKTGTVEGDWATRFRGPISLLSYLPLKLAKCAFAAMGMSCKVSSGKAVRPGHGERRDAVFHRSERLFLRPAWPEDWQAILSGANDEKLVRNLAHAPWPYGAEDAQSFAAMAQDPKLPHFLVTLPGAGVIGSAGLGQHNGQAEIGYWIARGYQGHGYATEAAGAVLQIARTLGHRQLTAGHFTDNPASGKVLRKLGFRPTGRVGRRHSRARGGEAPTVEFEIDLSDPAMQLPQAA